MTNNNPLLGQLISEHPSDGARLGAMKRLTGGCIAFLLLPVVGGLCGIVGYLTDSNPKDSASVTFYIGGAVIGIVIIVFLFWLIYRAPRWLHEKERVEIYENGLVVKRPLNNPTICLWQEIQTVEPVSPGDYIPKGGDEIVSYKIHKKDGGKLWVGRTYQDIERLDERLIPFWRENSV